MVANIDETKYADRAVDHHASGALEKLLRGKLQDGVGHRDDIPEVGEKVADAGARKLWHYGLVPTNHRQEYPLVEMVVEIVDTLVHAFPGVVDRGSGFETIRYDPLGGEHGLLECLWLRLWPAATGGQQQRQRQE